MRRKTLYRCMLVLFAVMLFLQGWGMLSVSAQANAETTEKSGGTGEGEEGPGVEVTDTYVDSHGVTYSWKGFEDGTAEIYGFVFEEDSKVVLDIPGVIEGYTVTKLTGSTRKTEIDSISIPESITQFGQDTFERCTIGTLNFNAVDAFTVNSFYFCPFAYAEIENFNIGDKVEKIESYMFYHTTIRQSEVVLKVPYIAECAFDNTSFEALRLTNEIQHMERRAFDQAEIQFLYYDCPDVEINSKDLTEGPFRQAVIGGLEFCQEITVIPDYLFCSAKFRIRELAVTQERIGDYAFYDVWDATILSTGYDKASRVTLTETVKYIGDRAFGSSYIDEVVILSDLETSAKSTTDGPFYMAHIYGLVIGEDIKTLPDYLFCNAYFQMQELTVDKPYVGTACFYGVWRTYSSDVTPAELTITEDVEFIGSAAFAYNQISKLHYEADASNNSTSTTNGIFSSSEMAGVSFGSQVKSIPSFCFANTHFLQDINVTLDMPIGAYAFYAASSSYGGFEHLVLGEHVSSVGKAAFERRDIEYLDLQAVSAAMAIKETSDAPFYGIHIGKFTIGDKVELLDKGFLCGAELSQEELVIPDSVKEIGNYFVYNSLILNDGVQIGTLRIGSGLRKMYVNSLREMQCTDIYVEAVEAAEDYDTTLAGGYVSYLPSCENLYIHKESAFYNYFSRNAEEIHLFCDGLMEASLGEEYLDEDARKFVTLSYETCSVCGYQIMTEIKVDAVAVTFKAMGQEVGIRYCKAGGKVEPPQAPVYEGYEFEGWDNACEGITEDTIVTAVYTENIPKYQITVHAIFADGTESETTTYEAESGEVITLPQYVASLPKVLLDGYEGERSFAPEFTWNIGEHDGIYEVTGEKDIVAREANYYLVQFMDENGTVISAQKVHSGYDATPPVIENGTVSGNDGITTKSWEKIYYNVTSDRAVRMESDKEYYVYAVSFMDENGNVLKTCSVTHGMAVAEPPAAPEKESDGYYTYSFQSWESGNGNNSTVDCVVEDTVFRPVYTATAIVYTVTFEANGGSPVAPVQVEGGKRVEEPEAPTREGFEFTGWYGDKALGVVYEFGAEVKADLTLYAGWKEKEPTPDPEPSPEPVPAVYTVTFETNGGSPIAPVQVEGGKRVEEPEAPTREGYEFTGWYGDEALGVVYEFGAEVKADLTLYAGWKEKEPEPTPDPEPSPEPVPAVYTVTFETNGGSPIAPVQVEEGKMVEEPEAPTREGYEFIGWYGDEALGVSYEFGAEVKADLTLYAGWKEKEPEPTPSPEPSPEPVLAVYTVTFETNGGSPIAPVQVEEGKKLEEPEAPTREGYGFIGWYGDEALGVSYEFGAEVKADLTLYAGWKEKEPEPTPGPEPSPEPVPEPTPSPEPIPSPKPTPSPEPDMEPSPEPGEETASDPAPILPEPDAIPVEPQPSPVPVIPVPAVTEEPGITDTHDDEGETDEVSSSEETDTERDTAGHDAEQVQEEFAEGEPDRQGITADKWKVVLPVAVSLAVGAGGSGGYFFLFWRRRRRLIGTVMNVDGETLENICVVFDGREVISNGKGEFAFNGVRRGKHSLCVFHLTGEVALTMDIVMDAQDETEAFTIIKDGTIKTDTHREGKKYFVDVVLEDEN